MPISHEYVQIKFNAILFNSRQNPDINLVISNSEGVEIVNEDILANSSQTSVSCGGQPASNPFYIVQKISNSDPSLNILIQTKRDGDRLGIANIEVYSGNCHPACSSCSGPT